MTTLPPHERAGERDWDAEFAAITGRLGDVVSRSDRAADNANRERFSHPHDAELRGFGRRSEMGSLASPSADASSPHEDGPTHEDGAPEPGVDDEPEVDDGDFVPPEPAPFDTGAEPAPFDTGDPATVIMVAALVVGPLWLLALAVFDQDAAGLWWLLAALTLAGGFVLAVMRQPKNRSDESDPDDGAQL